MINQLDLFDIPLQKVDEEKVENALRSFQLLSKERGNAPGGISVSAIPEKLKPFMATLVEKGYCKQWETSEKRYILKDEFRLWNKPEDIVVKFMQQIEEFKPSFNTLLNARTQWQINYHDPGVSEAIWQASVEHCLTQPVNWYLKDCSKMQIFSDYPKEIRKIFIDELLTADRKHMTIDEVRCLVDTLCNRYQNSILTSDKYVFKLSVSDYCSAFIINSNNEKELREVLNCCGGVGFLKAQINSLEESELDFGEFGFSGFCALKNAI